MNRRSKLLFFLLLAVFPFSLFAQNQTVIAAYMKVKPGQGAAYLEVEQAWKKIHEKGVELGIYNGWQLYQKLHAGTDDPYQYVTLMWYDDYAQTFWEDAPEGWQSALFTEEEAAELSEKTLASRDYAQEKVSHLVTRSDNQGAVNYIAVAGMKAKPGMESDYVQMEQAIFKPYFEEQIRRGQLTYWSIWNIWPFTEGEATYVAVQGFESPAQLDGSFDNIEPGELGLDMTWDEVTELAGKTREVVSLEIWELVDQVWAEEE